MLKFHNAAKGSGSGQLWDRSWIISRNREGRKLLVHVTSSSFIFARKIKAI